MKKIIATLLFLPLAGLGAETAPPRLEPNLAEKFARLALDCVHQEYPNKISHVLQDDRDVAAPCRLTPAFCGCYDWHSAVHGHWLLARLARIFPEAPWAGEARDALRRSLTTGHLKTEADYLAGKGRASFERPYGLAWLLQLGAELRQWDDPLAREWSANLRPLEKAAVDRLSSWLPKLSHPVRIGEHDQTAFALGLIVDYSRQSADRDLEKLVVDSARRFFLKDQSCPLPYEPSGQDFLSPCLGEADLMRRLLSPVEFAKWLSAFLPQIPAEPGAAWLPVVVATDPSDPKLAHLDGLNLSRAWMLNGIRAGLPADDPRRAALAAAAGEHERAGLGSVTGEHYEGGHWLGSFATYLMTDRGISTKPAADSPNEK